MDKECETSSDEMVGNYQLKKVIGKGGMGEIYLAHDPICSRPVALKKILPNLLKYSSIKERFLREAKIAAALTHPSIIPIYSLHIEEDQIYYTMPYIEGETLKSILRQTREQEMSGEPPHPIGSSIPSLIRIFLNVCQATDYTHTNGFLHRDLKADNIMVGKFGEVIILDWGIASRIGVSDEAEDTPEEKEGSIELTKPGKVVGTVSYMAPERAMGAPSTVQMDIYSLGVLLYQLLTLKLPFKRPSLKEFRKKLEIEMWTEPLEVAPHRDIPPELSRIAKKCLHPNPSRRYSSVHEMIADLEHYIEGCPEWIPSQTLLLNTASDWEFQENILLTKHMAISRLSGVMEWVMLMISKDSFSGNTRVETTVTLDEKSEGIGLLMCVPDAGEREGLEEGYLIWLGAKGHSGCKLFRSNVEVMDIPDVYLKPGKAYHISLEKIDNHLRLSVDGTSILNYVSHIPLIGGHIGVLSKDADYKLEEVLVSLGSQNVMVGCLSIPDAFLTSKDYEKALTEYRRIAHSFKGRAESREATFRAGITLLEKAKSHKTKKIGIFQEALDEFEKLRSTPGAPLEYLGKSLVYRAENDLEEEVKCLELAVRKFTKHPLIHQLEEHITFRFHETARRDRKGAYSFALLTLRHLPKLIRSEATKSLIENLTSEWEPLPFIETPFSEAIDENHTLFFAISLSFWLSKPTVLYEITHKLNPECNEALPLLTNILLALLEMGYPDLAQYILNMVQDKFSGSEFDTLKSAFERSSIDSLTPPTTPLQERILYATIRSRLSINTASQMLPLLKQIDSPKALPYKIWTYLLCGEHEKCLPLLQELDPSSDSYNLLYGCYLSASKGEQEGLAHFKPEASRRFPPTSDLLSHYLKGNIQLEKGWIDHAFLHEKVALYRELALYSTCLGKKEDAEEYEKVIETLLKKEQVALNFLE